MEFEAKILLSQEEYEKILKERKWSCPVTTKDTFFRLPSFADGQFFRIREKNNIKILTYKEKSIIESFENNLEEETVVTDINPILRILEEANYEMYFSKKTIVREDYFNSKIPLHLELKEIQGIKALEIESVNSEADIEEIKDTIIKAFSKILNIPKEEVVSRFETRSWKAMIDDLTK